MTHTPHSDFEAMGAPASDSISGFISRWQGITASELSTAQSFVRELCDVLGVPAPHATQEQDYMFERPITFKHGDGTSTAGRIDCYKRGHFVLEAKKIKPSKTLLPNKGFDGAMLRARTQAENYARALPAEEGRPPFLVVIDVGNVIELYAEFSRSGATYTPYPDPRSHRISLADLANPGMRERLRLLWTDPSQLDTSRISARITRAVALRLAELAKSLENSGHSADHVAAFLTRCLFCMFAEDNQLLPRMDDRGAFLNLLLTHRQDPGTLQTMLQALWTDMDRGGFSVALAAQVLKFNGKLFKQSTADGYSLLMTREQIERLILAAKSNWREVEPAIFGTLLERALDPTERHALGAHYTPRAYVERLVLPTVVAPLRSQWANVQAAAVYLVNEQKSKEAIAQVRNFLQHLCSIRVLDPACGSGNFLYVTLEHLKRIEGEVVDLLHSLGETQSQLGLEGATVTPQQLLGIEINTRAAALAELVLWIGYLQWHIKTRGNQAVAEPVVHDYGNIDCRDAVLACASQRIALDADGEPKTRWDGKTYRTHHVTGNLVPDEAATVVQWEYIHPQPAKWPKADFIVGNPPFIGANTLRAALGDGYVEALRSAWTEVPESADFVMHWWSRGADLVATGQTQRMGLITTNSLRQTFNRRVVQSALDKGVRIIYAIADHPWVDSANGAAVRIAMTVLERHPQAYAAPKKKPKSHAAVDAAVPAILDTVIHEITGEFGEVAITALPTEGVIHADLTIGANVTTAIALEANEGLCFEGIKPHGMGFLVTPSEAKQLGLGTVAGLERHIRDYRNGRDLTAKSRDMKIIDFFGLPVDTVKARYPAAYQWLVDRVKPERDSKRNTKDGAGYAAKWWVFGKPRQELRKSLVGLKHYIVTVKTAKHLVFQYLDSRILPDSKLIAVCDDHPATLGTLSSSVHNIWSLAQGSTLEDRPTYVVSRCFATFPFPGIETGLTEALQNRIAMKAIELDALRKRQLATHPSLTLTGMYNVLDVLREGRVLSIAERAIYTQGLVAILKELHDELDEAVLAAYGLSKSASKDAILTRLVALNTERALEEQAGKIRFLRPEFQNQSALPQSTRGFQDDLGLDDPVHMPLAAPDAVQAWPSELPAQVAAVAKVLSSSDAPLTLTQLYSHFKGKGAWKRGVPRILETLVLLGRASQSDDESSFRGL